MSDYVKLDDVSFGDEDIDALFKSWREAIENANRWKVTCPGGNFEGSPISGYVLNIPKRKAMVAHAVVTEQISAAPDANTMGHGKVTLRNRDKYALTSGQEDVEALNEFRVPIPVGTRVILGWDGGGWVVIGADCPLVEE